MSQSASNGGRTGAFIPTFRDLLGRVANGALSIVSPERGAPHPAVESDADDYPMQTQEEALMDQIASIVSTTLENDNSTSDENMSDDGQNVDGEAEPMDEDEGHPPDQAQAGEDATADQGTAASTPVQETPTESDHPARSEAESKASSSSPDAERNTASSQAVWPPVFELARWYDPSNWEADWLLCQLLFMTDRLLFIIGAGASTSLGIPDYVSGKVDRSLFRANVWADERKASKLLRLIADAENIVRGTEQRSTPFHRMLNNLMGAGRVLRLYTQNIDGVETHLSHLHSPAVVADTEKQTLAAKTVYMHGSIRVAQCINCKHTDQLAITAFRRTDGSWALPACPKCHDAHRAKAEAAGRPRPAKQQPPAHAVMIPRVTFYGAGQEEIDHEYVAAMKEKDCVESRVHGVIVAGTSLTVAATRQWVERLRKAHPRNRSVFVWMNKVPPGKSLGPLFDLIVLGDLDDIANSYGLTAA